MLLTINTIIGNYVFILSISDNYMSPGANNACLQKHINTHKYTTAHKNTTHTLTLTQMKVPVVTSSG